MPVNHYCTQKVCEFQQKIKYSQNSATIYLRRTKYRFFDGLCQNTQKNRKKRKTELKHCLFRDASVNWKPAQTGRHSRAPSSLHYAVTSQGKR